MTSKDKKSALEAVHSAICSVSRARLFADKWGDSGKALDRAYRALSEVVDALNLTPYENLRDAVANYVGECGYCGDRQDDDDPQIGATYTAASTAT